MVVNWKIFVVCISYPTFQNCLVGKLLGRVCRTYRTSPLLKLFVCSFLLDAGYNLKARWVAIPTVHWFTRNLLSWWLEVRLVVFLSGSCFFCAMAKGGLDCFLFNLHDCLILWFIHHHILFIFLLTMNAPEGRIKVAEGVIGGARCLKNIRQ